MPLLSKPAFGPRTAIIYITVGALIDVWTGVWYYSFVRGVDGPLSRNAQFWLWGFFLTGLTLIVVGALLGNIGRAARKAELPPADATPAEARIQETAAATPQPVVAGVTPNAMVGTNVATTPAMAGVAPAAAPSQVYVPGSARR
jgi:hypothetical protein